MCIRLDLDANVLGFAAPPVPVHVKFLPGRGGWTLLVQGPPGELSAVSRWFERYQPSEVRKTPAQNERALWLGFERLPKAWEPWLPRLKVYDLFLEPSGVARAYLEGPPREVQALIDAAAKSTISPVMQRLEPRSGDTELLTERQREALAVAIAEGYYMIPRKLNLRALAKKIDISAGSLSQLLRRAEAHIVAHYFASERLLRGDPDAPSTQDGTAPVPVEVDRRAHPRP